MTLLQTLATTLPVIFLVALGVVFRVIHFVSEATVHDIKSLVVNLTLPLLLFKAFATMQFEARFLLIVACVFGACTVVMLLASRLRFLPGLRPRYASYLMAGFEAGMLGYAVFSATYGVDAIPRFAVIDLGQVLFVFFILVTRLEASQSRRQSAGQTVLQFFKTPVIIGILAGVLANLSGLYRLLSGWELSNSLLHTAEILAGLTTPLVALVIGYELSFKAGALWHPLQTVAMRLLVWVSLALGFNALVIRGVLGLDPIFEAAVMLMAVLPGPFVIPLYLRQGQGEDRDYIVNTLSLGTVAALVGVVVVRAVY